MKTDLTMILVFLGALILYFIMGSLNRRKTRITAHKLPNMNQIDEIKEEEYHQIKPQASDFTQTKFAPLQQQENLVSGNENLFKNANLKPREPKFSNPSQVSSKKEPAKALDRFLVLNIHANEKGAEFVGYELLQTLLAVGLRFGEMSIFHRYIEINGQSIKLFSLARSTEPGIFDINNMGAVRCSGLTLFMKITSDPRLNEKAFDTMLATAKLLAEELNGVILDERRQEMSETAIAECRIKCKMI